MLSPSQDRGPVCSIAPCSPDHKTIRALLHEKGRYSELLPHLVFLYRMTLRIISLVSPSEQFIAQLSGLQKAVEGQSNDDAVHLTVVLPFISRCHRVCCVYILDVSATNTVPSLTGADARKQFLAYFRFHKGVLKSKNRL